MNFTGKRVFVSGGAVKEKKANDQKMDQDAANDLNDENFESGEVFDGISFCQTILRAENLQPL